MGKKRFRHRIGTGAGMATGIAIGIAIGAAMDNIAIGMCLGMAIGASFEGWNREKPPNGPTKDEPSR